MGIDYKRILIIQLQPVGDVLRATPVVAGLRREYPNAYIGFLVLERYKEILVGNPKLDEVISLKRDYYRERIREGKELREVFNELKEFAQRLKMMSFDLVINLHNTLFAAILAYLAKGRRSLGLIMNEFGWTSFSNNWKATPAYLLSGKVNVVEAYLESLGLDAKPKLEMYICEEEVRFRDEFLRSYGIGEGDLLIGLNPGGAVYSKRWPKERFAELGDRLGQEYGARIVLFGGPGDTELAGEMVDLVRSPLVNLAGRTNLKELAALIQRCNLFVTNDSGPMHIAAAVNTPTVAIFGSSSIKTNSPWGDNHIALQADLDCIPCTKSYCEGLRCLKSITVEQVLSSCRKILE